MKALYDKDGATPLQEVELLAWDWDKYVTFRADDGLLCTDKLWKFDVKCSNSFHHLAMGYGDEFTKLSRKDVAKLLKEKRKAYTSYSVKLEDDQLREFKSLQKALNFCKSNPCAIEINGNHKQKGWSCFCGIMEKYGDNWYYFTRQEFVSEVTLAKFCNSN